MLSRALFPALFVALVGCSGSSTTSACEGLTVEQCAELDGGTPDGGEPDGGIPSEPSTVVDTGWLEERLDDPDLQLIDTRASGYADSRIPGAIHLVPGDVAANVGGVSFQVAPPDQSEPVLRARGLRNGTTAIVYGEAPQYDSSWIVWVLRYYGHGDVRYLDGGFDAWVGAGGEVDSDPPSVEPTDYTVVGVDEDLVVTGEWVLAQIGDPPYEMPAIQVVDARGAGEYGSGHIPSARNVDWNLNLSGGLLLPRTELEPLYDGLDSRRTTVTYCSTGLRGSFDWLVLTALEYEDVRLYDGSWNEWGAGGFPIEQ
jgi:thiosulfate/3-mercaptopyruvate sulfurtransferase